MLTTQFGAQACRFEGETDSTSLTVHVTGLSAGTSYTFYPIAENAADYGSLMWSASQITAATSSILGAPTALAAGTATASSVSLTWTAPSENGDAWITDYTIQYKPTYDTSWSMFADGKSGTPSAIVTGLSAGTSYDFRVAAANAVGVGAYSDQVAKSIK